MTTRFSLAELADMLHTTVEAVRLAVDDLSAKGQLTAESFVFDERNWRIAPSDTKRIQEWIVHKVETGELTIQPPVRRVRRKHVVKPPTESES